MQLYIYIKYAEYIILFLSLHTTCNDKLFNPANTLALQDCSYN